MQIWNLDKLFPDGSASHQFSEHINCLIKKVCTFEEKSSYFCTLLSMEDSYKVVEMIEIIEDIQINLSQANSFITCLFAQKPNDQNAITLRGKTSSINARFDSALIKVQKAFAKTNQNLWENLLDTKLLTNYKFILNEWRKKDKTHLSDEEENLISGLKVDGFHAWGQLYQSFVSQIRVKVQISGEETELSIGQTINLRSHPDEIVRKKSHNALEKTWAEKEELFAKILNHIVGFRLHVNKQRGLKNILEEPLIENRMKEETLNAMWNAVNKNKQPFIKYLSQKAKLNGDKKMNSYNFWAPLTKDNKNIKYDDAVDYIIEQFSQFGTELESFSRRAFEEGWIEAENRPNKSTAAFCAGFPLSG